MTRYDPTLIVTRVIVERNTQPVYDEVFHEGVNVIRGDNSSGKSTVLNFIFYGLGGEFSDWSAVARLCTRVTVEVRVNGNFATLSREISLTNGQQPMEIFGGSYEASQKAPRSEWTRYPYRSTANRESFSQALFALMRIPEVSSDLSGHITMHQILRLLYADQLSPVENIFRSMLFDRADLRDTVGRLLCGAYDSTVYDNEQRIRELSKEFDVINGQLKSLFSVLGGTGQGFTFEWIDAQRKSLESERDEVQKGIDEAEQKLFTTSKKDKLTLAEQQKAYREVQSQQTLLIDVKHERDALALTIADSDAFLSGLRNKLESLRDSSEVATHIGEVRFQCCPACYAPLDSEPLVHACHLCKTPFDSEHTKSRIAALILDTGLQIKQSETLQTRRKERAITLEQRIKDVEAAWLATSRRLTTLQTLPSSTERERLRDLHRRSGYIERQIEDLDQKAKMAPRFKNFQRRKIS